MGMFIENTKRIEYYHHARRYLKERDPVAYETATVKKIEHVADALRHEAYRQAIDPYVQHKVKLLTDFYSLQTRMGTPQPQWLQEALASWDEMIAGVAREFGYTPDQPGDEHA